MKRMLTLMLLTLWIADASAQEDSLGEPGVVIQPLVCVKTPDIDRWHSEKFGETEKSWEGRTPNGGKAILFERPDKDSWSFVVQVEEDGEIWCIGGVGGIKEDDPEHPQGEGPLLGA